MDEERPVCPKCDSPSVAEIRYGRTDLDHPDTQLYETGELHDGGCCTPPEYQWHCNTCEHEWSSPEFDKEVKERDQELGELVKQQKAQQMQETNRPGLLSRIRDFLTSG